MTTTTGNEVAAATAPRYTAKKRSRARPYAILAGVVIVLLGAYAVFRAITAGKESTDDAQVATDMVPLSVRVAGTIISVPITDNQAVKKGDLIAQIDPADYEAKVKQAEADLAAAGAQADAAEAQMHVVEATSKGGLSSAKAVLSQSAASAHGADAQIDAAKASLDRSKVDSQKANTDLERAESLWAKQSIAQAQVDAVRATAAAARAAVAQAQAQLAAAEEMRRTAQSKIAEAEGRVEQTAPVDAQLAVAKANADLARARVTASAAALDQARLLLSNTTIVAPADGHVSKLAVHTGQLAQPGTVVTSLLPDTTYVIANFKETQVGEMRPGQTATISVDALPGRSFPAKVDSVSYGTGAQFSLLPPENASGNFVKVVQRVPVKLVWVGLPKDVRLQAGLSADVTVRVE